MEIIRSKRKTLAITIDVGGKVTIRSPLRTPLSYIEAFVKSKEKWIIAKVKEMQAHPHARVQPKQFVEGENFLYLGKVYRLHIGDYKDIHLDNGALNFPKKFLKNPKKKMLEFYYANCLQIISELCGKWSSVTGWRYTSIKIINANTKWGSCDHRNGLRFNWKLCLAPRGVLEYVVIHELAHIPEKNHSQKFWKNVERIIPDYKEKKKWLNDHGHMLAI